MTFQAQAAAFVERRRPGRDRRKRRYSPPVGKHTWPLYFVLMAALLFAAFLLSREHFYKPGDSVGYTLGLAGGLIMLTLLMYPLRKRTAVIDRWGSVPAWFRLHMVFGILGPTLIVLHSTFTIGSINAAVALACMVLVLSSGMFGRFVYAKVHHGLYGERASLTQLQTALDGYGDIRSVLAFAPDIQAQLIDFRTSIVDAAEDGRIRLRHLMWLNLRSSLLGWKLVQELEDAMYASRHGKRWNKVQMSRLAQLFHQNSRFIRSYIGGVRKIGQFEAYERLFSLWHLFHVPLIYMLVFSAIWHVIAVHMY